MRNNCDRLSFRVFIRIKRYQDSPDFPTTCRIHRGTGIQSMNGDSPCKRRDELTVSPFIMVKSKARETTHRNTDAGTGEEEKPS